MGRCQGSIIQQCCWRPRKLSVVAVKKHPAPVFCPSMATPSIADLLPPSLNLPPHLNAHKYFLVCTLTVAAWDTLVLSPRTWRLFKTPGWPALKILFHFLRIFMPIEFIIVGECCEVVSLDLLGFIEASCCIL